MHSLVRVVTSSESAARDESAIAAGIPSRALMQRAGAAAAGEIALRYRERLERGVVVLAGPGNNGGDAWVVARALVAAGVPVRVFEPVPAATADARAERTLAFAVLEPGAVGSGLPAESFDRGESFVVDGLLGTGAKGAARGEIASAIVRANAMRARGAVVAALDVPSGLDASTGVAAGAAVAADLTLTFGTLKRAHLVNRDLCGAIVVLDIGLGTHALLGDGAPELIDEPWVAERVPAISASAHKGVRGKIAIVGGANGMAGAATLAARAALRSGVGMVKLVVHPDSVAVVQENEPYALAAAWPHDAAGITRDISSWADGVVIGPGLGRTSESRELLEGVLRGWRGPTLLDADALTLFEGPRVSELAALLGGRPALITPHPAEFARLSGQSIEQVLDTRFTAGLEMAKQLQATVLLKGVPTIVSSADGRRLVSAAGTPALATAGSGDVLSGIAGALLVQVDDPCIAAAIGAWIHGRAAERVPATGAGVRGITLDDVVGELRGGWTFDARPGRYPVLVELPNVASVR